MQSVITDTLGAVTEQTTVALGVAVRSPNGKKHRWPTDNCFRFVFVHVDCMSVNTIRCISRVG